MRCLPGFVFTGARLADASSTTTWEDMSTVGNANREKTMTQNHHVDIETQKLPLFYEDG